MPFMMEMFNFFLILLQELLFLVMILLSVAFFSLMERKILSYVHFRKGPNKVIISGFLQPFADALKLLTKDDSPVLWSNKILYFFSPLFMFVLAMISWVVFPFFWGVTSNKLSFLITIIIMGLSVYGIMFSGWSSNSTYSMLGSMRSISQSISYEVVLSFIFLSMIFIISDYSIEMFYDWKLMKIFIFSPFLLSLTCFSLLAEMNRTPFDLAEGESELVSGYSVEYGGVSYTVIFLSENIMIFFSSFLITYFFFNNLTFFMNFFMFSFMSAMICLIRGVLPRFRYDKLMMICWMVMLPLILLNFNLIVLLCNFFNFKKIFIFCLKKKKQVIVSWKGGSDAIELMIIN
uniref:NADH-ubiquinone oxidoreductase chain 1 n=1 Tax=Colpocephalum griffoneae TaxID=2358484 RepID=A0A386B2S4_9NEOP|nr:NADH dehydrogenase subunit 1 [Colpocephalum griffoneae]AYC65904.1 NADH dehydrogenase subunit 1 [Colpocephalum griffoneae]